MMFKSALFKLTFYYTAIAVVLSLLLSVFIYHFATVELREGLRNQYTTITSIDHDKNANKFISNSEFHERASQLYLHLIYFNLAVFILATAISYLLARYTLGPIQKAHEDQVRFTAHASHELRTPLSAIRADTESVLMAKDYSVELYRNTLKENLRDVKHMEELTNHLLNAALFRSKQQEIKTIDLHQLVRTAIGEFKRFNSASKVTIKVEAVDINVRGDPLALQQVILTLLDNAFKFGERKPIKVILNKTLKHAIIQVVDQGKGIDGEDLKHIFKPFYRSTSRKTQSSGFGLGLSLAKEIVDASGGSISAANADAGGTIFTLRLRSV